MTFKFLLLLDLSWKILQTFFTCSPNGPLSKICGDFGKNAFFDFYGQKNCKKWVNTTGCDSLSRLHLPRPGPRSIHVTQDSHGVNRHLRARWSTDLKMVLQQEEISSVQAHTYRKRDLSHYTYYAGMGYFSPPRCTLMCCGGFLL